MNWERRCGASRVSLTLKSVAGAMFVTSAASDSQKPSHMIWRMVPSRRSGHRSRAAVRNQIALHLNGLQEHRVCLQKSVSQTKATISHIGLVLAAQLRKPPQALYVSIIIALVFCYRSRVCFMQSFLSFAREAKK